MSRYILQRLILLIPLWVAVGVVSFFVVHATPGDPAAAFLGQEAQFESKEAIYRRLGLDKPLYVQLANWIVGAAHGDLGQSFFLGRSVSDALLERLPVTFSLTSLALPLATAVGIPLGIMAAIHPNSWTDGLTTSVALFGLSVPEFVTGMLLIFFFAVQLGWFPVGGYQPLTKGAVPWLQHLTLPALSLGLMQAGLLARITRASMLQVLDSDYIRTARAKGLRERVVLVKHALRNAIISIVTVIGLAFTILMSGAFITETLFQLPGVGNLAVSAVLRRDYPVIQGELLLISTIVLVVNILVDVAYSYLNPTITYS
ncbi:MAG TPA: ABC transporter permease [bacterium]|nr:ABC transporter permease [bacterium]